MPIDLFHYKEKKKRLKIKGSVMAELPEELLLLDIFSRLPTKFVGRCRCLSKSWRTNLSTTTFINKHLITRQRQQQNPVLITTLKSLRIVTWPLKNDDVQVTLCRWRLGRTVGTCNGLVLALTLLTPEKDEYELMLLNPITRQQVKIPRSSHVSSGRRSIVYEFGYDCSTDDFKVIKFCNCRIDDSHSRPIIVDVFSVKRGSWKTLDSSIYPYVQHCLPVKSSFADDGAFVNGAVHCFICDFKNSGVLSHIAAFDLANEVFREVPIPADFNRTRFYSGVLLNNHGLAVIGGCLSIVYHLSNGGGTDVWMMKEYGVAESWVRLHIVAPHEYRKKIKPLCFVGYEQLMCFTYDGLLAYDLKDNTSMKLIVGGGGDSIYYDGMAFVESLISPGKCELDDGSG